MKQTVVWYKLVDNAIVGEGDIDSDNTLGKVPLDRGVQSKGSSLRCSLGSKRHLGHGSSIRSLLMSKLASVRVSMMAKSERSEGGSSGSDCIRKRMTASRRQQEGQKTMEVDGVDGGDLCDTCSLAEYGLLEDLKCVSKKECQ